MSLSGELTYYFVIVQARITIMKNLVNGVLTAVIIAVAMACGWRASEDTGTLNSQPLNSASNSTANSTPAKTPVTGKKAFQIEGTIDDAKQEGKVCDTSLEFTVPGTLEFKFTPTDAAKGNYTYSGPFNATGSGPYEIKDDGTMIVDGTGCIMGRCATYSHKWKAKPIDAVNCKPGK